MDEKQSSEKEKVENLLDLLEDALEVLGKRSGAHYFREVFGDDALRKADENRIF